MAAIYRNGLAQDGEMPEAEMLPEDAGALTRR